MKFVVDEKLKHRLVGAAVLLSVVGAFFPFVFKSNDSTIDDGVNVSVQLPPKPALDSDNHSGTFTTSEVAHVALATEPVTETDVLPESQVSDSIETLPVVKLTPNTPPKMKVEAKVEPVSDNQVAPSSLPSINDRASIATVPAKPTQKTKVLQKKSLLVSKPLQQKTKAKSVIVQQAKATKSINHKSVVAKKTSVKVVAKPLMLPRGAYFTVQVANLTKQSNVNALVQKLRTKGFTPSVRAIKTKTGMTYKVQVGREIKRDGAIHLQKRINHSLTLNGIVVKGEG